MIARMAASYRFSNKKADPVGAGFLFGSGGKMAFAANAALLVSAPLSDATHRGASA